MLGSLALSVGDNLKCLHYLCYAGTCTAGGAVTLLWELRIVS